MLPLALASHSLNDTKHFLRIPRRMWVPNAHKQRENILFYDNQLKLSISLYNCRMNVETFQIETNIYLSLYIRIRILLLLYFRNATMWNSKKINLSKSLADILPDGFCSMGRYVDALYWDNSIVFWCCFKFFFSPIIEYNCFINIQRYRFVGNSNILCTYILCFAFS